MSLMPNYLLREWTNDGKLASGGFLYFYNSLTLTPKAVYSDATLTTPLTNPVQLDASGSAVIFMGPGAYRIWLKDKDGAQIAPWVDGIIGDGNSGSGINSNATFSTVKIYQDLRDLTVPTDFVYVSGRTMVGDGGAGIFQRIPTPTTDDDGIILNQASGSISYKRVFDSFIDPQWFGVKYLTVIDNTTLWNRVTVASALYNCSIVVTGGIYINQNITIPSYSNIIFNDNGYFYSTLSTTITFSQGSNMTSEGIAFGLNVSPKFNLNTVDSIKLSWMGGQVEDDILTKLINAPGAWNTPILIDYPINTTLTSFNVQSPVEFLPSGNINFVTGTNALTISVPNIVDSGYPMLIIPNNAAITLLDFGNQYAKPDWFSVSGQDRAIYYALKTGKCELIQSKTYSATTAFGALPAIIEIIGKGTLQLTTSTTISTQYLTIRDITVVATGGTYDWATATTLFRAFDAAFPSTYTATSKVVSGCVYTDDSRFPVYNGKPSLYNGHLPLILKADTLATDANGKIYGKNLNEYDANWNINSLTTAGGTGNATRGFGETPTHLIKSDGSTSFWVRDKFNTFAAWSLITPSIPYYYANQRTIEFVWYAGSAWYAATSCTNGTDFHAEIFRSTDPDGINAWTLLNTAPEATQYYQQWTGFKQLTDGTVYITKGALNNYVYGQIYKVSSTSVTLIPYGINTTNLNILALDEQAGYIYLAAQWYDYTNMFMLRLKISDGTVANVSGAGILQCMGFLGTRDTAIAGIGTGNIYRISNLKSTPFAPVFSTSWASFNMGAIRTMVNADYTVTAGSDGGLLGVMQSEDTWQSSLSSGSGNNRYFSRRLSGVEGNTFNTVAYNFTCSYYVEATGETLLGGTGSSVVNRY